MSQSLLDQLREAIIGLEESKAKDIAKQGIEEGVDCLDMINQGIRAALDFMGERFASGAIFLPELVLAAKAADAAVEILEPDLLKRGGVPDKLGKVLMATVKGDIHDIGKNIVTLFLKSSGFEVMDIGVGKSSEEILDTAKRNEVDLIGLSALLTTTMPRMKEFIEFVKEREPGNRFKVFVGGAPITRDFADSIGADGYGADAAAAVEVAKKLLGR
jgi:5-methyltetrahydrofolate--homocysteine methyltransferase